MCWLYNHDEPSPSCELCQYVVNNNHANVSVTTDCHTGYCVTTQMPETVRRARVHYMEKVLFLPASNTVTDNQDDDDNDRDTGPTWMALHKRVHNSDDSDDDDDSDLRAFLASRKRQRKTMSRFDDFVARRSTAVQDYLTRGVGGSAENDREAGAAEDTPETSDTVGDKPAASDISVGARRLLRFMNVLRILNGKKNIKFKQNWQMLKRLTSTHLRFIVGQHAYDTELTSLQAMIDTELDLMMTQNIIWYTNRQQGKTTTVSLFLAALSYCAITGGNLCGVYATGRNRAKELVDGAKTYLYAAAKDEEKLRELERFGMSPPVFETDNAHEFSIRCGTDPLIVNRIAARPKTVTACRGDNFDCLLVDEAAFVEVAWWWVFMYPLLTIKGRVITLISTPAPLGNFFDEFVKDIENNNKNGNYFFRLINHSLSCPACYEAGVATKCCHKLYLVPPWKSLVRFEHMRKLVPDKRKEDYEKETYGVIDRGNSAFLPEKLVDTVLVPWKAPPRKLPTTAEIYISVDPPAQKKSSMGLTAITYDTSSVIHVLGISEVPMRESDTDKMLSAVKVFTAKSILSLVDCGKAPGHIRVTPVVECNNCGFISEQIVTTIKETTRENKAVYEMPYSKNRFAKHIVEGVGVWTEENNKLAAISNTYAMLFENRVRVSPRCVTVGQVREKGFATPLLPEALQTLRVALKNFKRQPTGEISGKTTNNNDDLAMAFMLALYWSQMIRLQSGLDKLRM